MIIVPAFNEEGAIAGVVREVARLLRHLIQQVETLRLELGNGNREFLHTSRVKNPR